MNTEVLHSIGDTLKTNISYGIRGGKIRLSNRRASRAAREFVDTLQGRGDTDARILGDDVPLNVVKSDGFISRNGVLFDLNNGGRVLYFGVYANGNASVSFARNDEDNNLSLVTYEEYIKGPGIASGIVGAFLTDNDGVALYRLPLADRADIVRQVANPVVRVLSF